MKAKKKRQKDEKVVKKENIRKNVKRQTKVE